MKSFQPFPRLDTKRLTLRNLRPEDAAGVLALHSNPDGLSYVDRLPKTDINQARRFILRAQESYIQQTYIMWAVTRPENSQFMGTVCLWHFNEAKNCAEIGYELLPEFQGKGYAFEAVTGVLTYAFEELAMTRIEALSHPDNLCSTNLLVHCGFAKQPEVRVLHFKDGREVTHLLYTLDNPKRH